MLGQLILVVCAVAGCAASCILFVLFGPVPVRRKVTIVPRLMPNGRLPFSMMAVSFDPPASPEPIHAAPPPPPAPVAVAVEPLVTPLVLRRPRGDTPPPRTRMARGTESRPRDLDVAREKFPARRLDVAATDKVPLAFEVEDHTFVDDGR